MSKVSQPWLCRTLNHTDDQHNETQLLSVWVSDRAWTPCTVHLGCAWDPLLSLDLLLCDKNLPRTHGRKLSSTSESCHIIHVQAGIHCPIWTCPCHSSQSWIFDFWTPIQVRLGNFLWLFTWIPDPALVRVMGDWNAIGQHRL